MRSEKQAVADHRVLQAVIRTGFCLRLVISRWRGLNSEVIRHICRRIVRMGMKARRVVRQEYSRYETMVPQTGWCLQRCSSCIGTNNTLIVRLVTRCDRKRKHRSICSEELTRMVSPFAEMNIIQEVAFWGRGGVEKFGLDWFKKM